MHRHTGILKLLGHGLALDALALEEMSFADAERSKGEGAAGLDEEALIQRIDEFVADAVRRGDAGAHTDSKPTTHSFDARRRAVTAFFKKMPFTKCSNCACFAPTLRREGMAKVFRSKLSAKHQRANDEMGARTSAAHLFASASKVARRKKANDDDDDDDEAIEDVDEVDIEGGAMRNEDDDEEEEADQDDEDDIDALTADAFSEAAGTATRAASKTAAKSSGLARSSPPHSAGPCVCF